MCLRVTYRCVNYYFYSKVYRTLKIDVFGTTDYVLSSPFHCASNFLFYPLSLSQLMTPTLSTHSAKPKTTQSSCVFLSPSHAFSQQPWVLVAQCVLSYCFEIQPPGPKVIITASCPYFFGNKHSGPTNLSVFPAAAGMSFMSQSHMYTQLPGSRLITCTTSLNTQLAPV